MRILFSGTPLSGHLLPMMPLAMTARRTGHDIAILTNGGMTDAVRPIPVLSAGVTFDAMIAEASRRKTDGPMSGFSPEMLAECFVNIRLDLGGEEALAQARAFKPDLIVAEDADFPGRLAAAALGVPWVSHKLGGVIPPPVVQALDRMFAAQLSARGLAPTPRLAELNLWPDRLQPSEWTAPADQVTIRPQPFEQEGISWAVPHFPGREELPLVLVTLGTLVDDPALLLAILASVTAVADVNLVVTFGSQEKADAAPVDRSRILAVGFVPLAQLLEGVSLVVSAGGSGTVLAALSRGLPLVVLPVIADQHLNAERTEAAGVAVTSAGPAAVGAAVRKVLADPSYRTSAEAEQIAQMNSPEQALDVLLERVRGKVQREPRRF